MNTLAVTLFGFLHALYCKFYKEPEYARFFAASIISVIMVIAVAVVLTYFLFELNPLWSFKFYSYYRYFGVVAVIWSWWFINPEEREERYLKSYVGIGKGTRFITLLIISILVFFIFYLYFEMGDKLREAEIPL